MEEISEAFVDQQVKAYLHTLEQIKHKMRRMTLAFDTQQITTSQPVEIDQVPTIVEKSQLEQNQI